MTQKIIAVVNQKGGVGKTTTTINCAAQVASSGFRVLLIDLDPQGNATSGLGIAKDQRVTAYDLMCHGQSLTSAVLETHVAQLYLVPSNTDLAGAEIELVSKNRREYTLQDALGSSEYDYVFIDCPPSLGLLTVNALTAASLVMMPVQTEYYALEGLSQLLNTVQAVKHSTNQQLELLGVVLTMYDKRTSLSEQVREEVKKYFGENLFRTVIPRNVRLAEAPSFGKTIFEHDKWSKGARAYKALAKEIVLRTT